MMPFTITPGLDRTFFYLSSGLASALRRFRGGRRAVDLLQAPYANWVAPSRSNRLHRSHGAAHGGDAWNAVGDGIPADGLFIAKRVGIAGSGVDDQVDRPGLQQIHGIG